MLAPDSSVPAWQTEPKDSHCVGHGRSLSAQTCKPQGSQTHWSIPPTRCLCKHEPNRVLDSSPMEIFHVHFGSNREAAGTSSSHLSASRTCPVPAERPGCRGVVFARQPLGSSESLRGAPGVPTAATPLVFSGVNAARRGGGAVRGGRRPRRERTAWVSASEAEGKVSGRETLI